MSLIELVFQFLDFVSKSLLEVPLSLTIGSAIIVTFVWFFNEVAGRVLLWRAAIVTVWTMIGLNEIIPLRTLGKAEMWSIVLLVAALGVVLTRLSRRRFFKKKCPHCGAELARV